MRNKTFRDQGAYCFIFLPLILWTETPEESKLLADTLRGVSLEEEVLKRDLYLMALH